MPPLESGQPQPLSERIRLMTDEEFYEFCQENEGFQVERNADGTIKVRALTGGETGRKHTKLTSRLDFWAQEAGLGGVFDSSTGFRLPNGAHRSPDVAFVTLERWEALPDEQRTRFPPVCPDFVVELLSESDASEGTARKIEEYLANGCCLAWLLDPKTEQARVYRPDGSVRVVRGFDQSLSGEDVLPGFSFELRLLRQPVRPKKSAARDSPAALLVHTK